MAKLEIDWSIEKTKLRFEEPTSPRRERIFRRAQEKAWTFSGAQAADDTNPDAAILHLLYDGEVIGYTTLGRAPEGQWKLGMAIDSDHSSTEFIRNSLVRVALLSAQLQLNEIKNSDGSLTLEMEEPSSAMNHSLTAMGFERSNEKYRLNLDLNSSRSLNELKRYLLDYVKAAPKVGRGYLLDASRLPFAAVSQLNDQYHEVAWGLTNWARHSSIGSDEIEMIEKYARGRRGLEVGAGSGRVTMSLLRHFDHLTATDVIANALEQIRTLVSHETLQKLDLKVDDITKSDLASESFDVVMFWENGLGALLTESLRKQAIDNMIRLLAKGGRLILGVRSLISEPIDQLMVAAQTDLVLGIYHTFTADELRRMMPPHMVEVAIHQGQPRPAGGHQIFAIFEKQ